MQIRVNMPSGDYYVVETPSLRISTRRLYARMAEELGVSPILVELQVHTGEPVPREGRLSDVNFKENFTLFARVKLPIQTSENVQFTRREWETHLKRVQKQWRIILRDPELLQSMMKSGQSLANSIESIVQDASNALTEIVMTGKTYTSPEFRILYLNVLGDVLKTRGEVRASRVDTALKLFYPK